MARKKRGIGGTVWLVVAAGVGLVGALGVSIYAAVTGKPEETPNAGVTPGESISGWREWWTAGEDGENFGDKVGKFFGFGKEK